MPPTVAAIIAILIGLVGCFYGYPLFRVFLILVGLIVGYNVGLNFVAPDNTILALAIGIVAAIILAVLAYPLWSVGILIAGAALGFAFGSSLALALTFDQTGVLLLGVLGAILLGVLFFAARDLMAMLATAFNGAALTINGIAILFPSLGLTAPGNLLALLLIIILGAIGFAVQYRLFGGRRLYSTRL